MRPPLIDHSIISNAQNIKCFVLTELDDKSLFERILAPRTAAARRIVSEAFSCRAVCFNQKERRYVFNGATQGKPPPTVFTSMDMFFDGNRFPTMGDCRQHSEHSQGASGQQCTDSVRQDGARAPPIVSDWLASIDSATMMEPGVNKEVLSDTKKLLFGDLSTGNRPRVPKGMSLQLGGPSSGLSPPVANNPTEVAAKDDDAFNALLGSNANDSSSEANHSVAGSLHSSVSPVGSIIDFDAIFANTKDERRSEVNNSHQHGPGSTTRAEQPPDANPLPAFQSTGRHDGEPGAFSTARSANDSKYSFHDPPSYGKEFALVDKIGLTASPASTAKWELENNVRTPRKPKQRTVVLRPIVSRTIPMATSLTTPSVGCEGPIASVQPLKASSDQVENKAVHTLQDHLTELKHEHEPAISTGQKYHDNQDGEIKTEGVLAFPPSFTKKYNTMNQKARPRSSRKKFNAAAKGNSTPRAVLPLPDPIPSKHARKVASSAEVTSKGPYPRGGHQLPSSAQVTAGAACQDKQRKALNVQEPLQQTPLKDANGVIQPHNYQNSEMASLVERILQKQAAKLLTSFEESESDSDDNDPLPSDLLNLKIKAEIGLIFTLAKENVEPCHKVQRPSEFQSALRNNPENWRFFFLPRLTTSADDAAFMVSLCPSGFSLTAQEVLYELHFGIRTETETHSILVNYNPSGSKTAYSVVSHESIHCNHFLHFPEHVWDARVLLTSAPTEYDLREEIDASVREFLTTLQTDFEPPSFRGRYRCEVIRPHQIFAKRILTYSSGKLSFLITEIQDLMLHVDALDDVFHSVCARSGSYQALLDEQRVWVEARFETSSISEADTIHNLVRSMVEGMDGVGMKNQGPLIYNSSPSSDGSGDGREAPPNEIEW